MRRALYYGDCYSVLQKHIAPESVDLVRPATSKAIEWAGKCGFVKEDAGAHKVPVIQCRTVAQLLRSEAFAFPWNSTVRGIPKAGEGQGILEMA